MGNREDEITAWFAGQSRPDPERVLIGIGDDMAQVRVDSGSVLITTDMLLDGVHFDLAALGAERAGRKAMNASLSDCAAMATRPLCAVAAVALPTRFGPERLRDLHRGMTTAGRAFDCELVGGDLTAWQDPAGRFAINITMLSVPANGIEPVRRNGARAGDVICVTGELGGSLASGKHADFTPRVWEAIALAGRARLSAMMDLSDGLSTDLNRICRQSGVGARIEAAQLPLSEAARRAADPLACGLNDGEDFELLFTLSEEEYANVRGLGYVTAVGRIVEGEGIQIVQADGRTETLQPGGFDHL